MSHATNNGTAPSVGALRELLANVERWLGRLVRGFRTRTCRHRFDLKDQTLTGILPPLPPRSASPREWERYGREVVCGDHPWHTHRVAWHCAKCGTVFYAHCGLDILAGRGTRNPPNK